MTTVENFASLYSLTSATIPNPYAGQNGEPATIPNPFVLADGDMAYVKGFWGANDGGGGFFIFDANSDLNPVFNDVNYFKIGYNANYDGMVCKAESLTSGRWIRQWDTGKLNLRWFGARPDYSETLDTSFALNAALEYAQFTPVGFGDPGETIFNSEVYTRPGKTIHIPAGRYKFYSAVSSIYYGVVIEGEGNRGTSSHGTRLLIFHEYTAADEAITGIGRDGYGFLRYYANEANNSGGGLRDLAISVEKIHQDNPDGTPDEEDINNGYDSNIVLLMAPDRTPPAPLTYCPSVSKWKAENVVFAMRARARRAIYMRSYQEGGVLPWRIRDTSLVNCWFAGARLEGETVRAMNSSALHVTGGFFSSGLGVNNESITPGIVLGGTFGCSSTHLSGVDLTHAIIQIDKKSSFTNIDCRFGKLLIYNGPGNDHEALHVTKRFILNERVHTNASMVCSHPDTPTNYNCYNNAHQIECDTNADWMHNQPCPTP